ncbi:hypothetical protein FRC01_007346, partial [Tulasnella sp. 417]
MAPTTLKLTRSQLSYLLTRIEGVGINVGNLDIPVENPRPSQLLPKKDVSDAQSISSFVSNLSLSPASWWTKPTPIDVELKYLYSSFTKLPALHLTNPPAREPERHALPLDAFKNLQTLTLEDIDPRTLLGWDRLAESIRSFTLRRSGIEDVTHMIVDAVADDEGRRKKGDLAPIQWKPLSRRPSQVRSRQPSWQSSLRRTTVIPESDEDTKDPPSPQVDAPPTPPFSSSSSDHNPDLPKLSSSKWWCIRYLNLADNSLTFFPSEVVPYLTSVTHLDLSNNLLVSVPAGLGELHRLTSLNLSGNMIESVLGIYTQLGQVLTLNLGGNRIDSLCGLERLVGLQRIDLRNNRVEESAEVGRLATLPDVAEIWVGGNPLTTLEEDWRVNCFAFFAKERKNILLDGYAPGFLETGRIQAIVGTPKVEPVTVISSPQVAAVRSGGHSRTTSAAGFGSPTLNGGASTPSQGSPQVTAVGGAPSTSASSPAPSYMVATIHTAPKSKRRKQPRIVHLDEGAAAAEAADTPSREMSPARIIRASPLSSSPAMNPSALPSTIPTATEDEDPFADPPSVEVLNSPTTERRTSR